jgi:pullulanase
MIRLGMLIAVWMGTIAAGQTGATPPNAPATQPQLLTIHYHRFDGDYDQAGLWTWDEGLRRAPQDNELMAAGRDDFGVIFKLDPSLYGQAGERIGLLPRLRKDWAFKDNGDRYWSPQMGREIFIVEGRSDVYTTRPDVSPRLLGAVLDGLDTITLRFTHRLAPPTDPIVVRDLAGPTVAVKDVKAIDPAPDGRSRALTVSTAEHLEVFNHAYEVRVPGFEPCRIRLGRVLLDPQFHDPDARLGATYSASETTFRVFSPMAEAAEVVIAEARAGGPAGASHAMTRNSHGTWSVSVPGDLQNKFYAYRFKGPGLDPNREVTDVSATCAQGLDGRALIVDLTRTNPPGFNAKSYVTLASPADAVVYEMHVRDFSIAPNSGMTHKGQYLALTETGTHLPDDAAVKTGLDHLVELGVTHVQLLPLQDFENNERGDAYSWGYVTTFFNTPEGWYATTPDGDARIREFKQAVQALHARGIGVVMDVVYNHTSARATFELTAPGYYFRMRPDGTFWNGSGCGNEVASENPMVRKFIVDSLAYWVSEYGVDGFRFDLMALIDLDTMLAVRDRLRQINPSVLLYGEPWAGGQAAGLAHLTDKQAVRGTGLGAFNDDFRDAIKGDRNDGPPGFIQNGDRLDRVRRGVQGALDDSALHPADAITYCEAHDNLTTWDKLLQSASDAPEAMKKRMQRLAGLLVLTSQGMSFLDGGQEFCRSKGGNHNSYNAPDAVNQYDWSLKKANADVFAYYRGLIALRKAHPVFRLRSGDDVRKRLQFLRSAPASRCLVYQLDGRELPGETWTTVLVLLNGEAADQTFALPPGTWKVVADADRAGVEPLVEAAKEVKVAPHSGMVLHE